MSVSEGRHSNCLASCLLRAWELLADASPAAAVVVVVVVAAAVLSATVNDKSMYTMLAWDPTLMCVAGATSNKLQVPSALLPGE